MKLRSIFEEFLDINPNRITELRLDNLFSAILEMKENEAQQQAAIITLKQESWPNAFNVGVLLGALTLRYKSFGN